jgi:hypothetical protein
MLTFLASVAIMFTVVGSLVTWAKREERRRAAASEFEGIEEVLGSAGNHR